MKRLIVLRPEPGASATVSRAREMRLEAVAMPLFAIEPVSWEIPDPASFDGLLLTSANAVREAGGQLQRLRALRAHCVGEATADTARGAGFDIAAVGTSGVERLLASIQADQRLLHLAGEDRTDVKNARQSVTAITVYRASELPVPPQIDQTEGSVVLVHSPRAARRFAEIAGKRQLDRSTIAIVAISSAAAAEAGEGWLSVQVAEAPDDPSLLALARSLCNKPA